MCLDPTDTKLCRTLGLGLGSIAILVAAFAVPAWWATHSRPLSWAWLYCVFLLIAFCMIVGAGVNKRLAGLIIDNRNRVSLSKFQTAAWTILILSALVTSVFARLAHGIENAAEIAIPQNLFAVMAISLTSLVAAPSILSVKSTITPADSGQADATQKALGDSENASVGKVYARTDVAEASLLDMFRGDEVSNAASADLSKVQKFLITIVLIVGYGGALWAMFAKGIASTEFCTLPDFGEDSLLLLGTSHAGYLVYKSAQHGSTQDPSANKSAGDGAVG